eukprot:6932763-Pyramimonas_sp.AAC.2
MIPLTRELGFQALHSTSYCQRACSDCYSQSDTQYVFRVVQGLKGLKLSRLTPPDWSGGFKIRHL